LYKGDFHRCEAPRVEHRPAISPLGDLHDSFVLCDESAFNRKVVMMDNTPTPAPGPLARVRAWLRGDRFMVDSRPPAPVVAEPAAAAAPITTAHDTSKEG
jgi:hypothetical protein